MNGSTMDAALTGLRRAGREISQAKDTLNLVRNLDLDAKTTEELNAVCGALVKARSEVDLTTEGVKWRSASPSVGRRER